MRPTIVRFPRKREAQLATAFHPLRSIAATRNFLSYSALDVKGFNGSFASLK